MCEYKACPPGSVSGHPSSSVQPIETEENLKEKNLIQPDFGSELMDMGTMTNGHACQRTRRKHDSRTLTQHSRTREGKHEAIRGPKRQPSS